MAKKTKIAIIGASGQLGQDLVWVFKKDTQIKLYPLTHKELEVTDSENIERVFSKISPNIIINCAAYHKVDEVEGNPEKAFLVNAISVKNLAQFCKLGDITMVFISTDYIFGQDFKRKAPYREIDIPGPINIYGFSKLAGEYFIKYINPKHFIVRSSGLFGRAGSASKGGNFVERMITLAKEGKPVRVVADQILAPTYTKDLAKQITVLVKTRQFGLYHAVSLGQCSWYQFAKEIFSLSSIKVDLKAVESAEFPTPAFRPAYSVLENYNLKKLKLNLMRNWKEGLRDYLAEKGYIQNKIQT